MARHPDSDDFATNTTTAPSLGDLVQARMDRRQALRGLAAAAAAAALPTGAARAGTARRQNPSTLRFQEIHNRVTTDHRVAPGYRADVLLRWGDPVLGDAPPFAAGAVDAAAQAKQFGYNNDFLAYLPLPRGSANSNRGLLCVNHEYTDPELMWPDLVRRGDMSAAQVEVDIAAHGHSVVEVVRENGKWRAAAASSYNRRLTAATPMRLSGPVAGDRRVCTKADPSGRRVLGTFNNCAGGVTPWGTVLIAEENIHSYFSGDPSTAPGELANHKRMGIVGAPAFPWGAHHARFDVEAEPNEPNRFGWIVEYDPYDPFSIPTKRTALGRCKHEGATTVVSRDGRVVVYTGDDQAFEYLYKFVSHGRFDADDPKANRDLLDDGTLFVAQLQRDGSLRWLPLVFGTGPLTPANGFGSQADVLIETRRAADLLGATPMDRPEDVEPNPATGRVYAVFTNNSSRTPQQRDEVHVAAPNLHGHILEIIHPGAEDPAGGTGAKPADVDHAALTARWEVFLRGGDPRTPGDHSHYHPDVTAHGWLSCPDNLAFDPKGRMWIATDQGTRQAITGVCDGLRVCDTTGDGRALTRNFYAVPTGAELCGPCFTPDGETLFVAVQHPADGHHPGDPNRLSTFADPSTRWPDFDDAVPPRPSVVAITRDGGGVIGD